MNLLDRAVKLAAEQEEPEEMNFVRKHAREQVTFCLPCLPCTAGSCLVFGGILASAVLPRWLDVFLKPCNAMH